MLLPLLVLILSSRRCSQAGQTGVLPSWDSWGLVEGLRERSAALLESVWLLLAHAGSPEPGGCWAGCGDAADCCRQHCCGVMQPHWCLSIQRSRQL